MFSFFAREPIAFQPCGTLYDTFHSNFVELQSEKRWCLSRSMSVDDFEAGMNRSFAKLSIKELYRLFEELTIGRSLKERDVYFRELLSRYLSQHIESSLLQSPLWRKRTMDT
jgi:hypothetical protein